MEKLQPSDTHLNGVAPPSIKSTENPSTKRQRRPSVRLGDLGENQTHDNRKAIIKHCKPPIKGLRSRNVVNLGANNPSAAGDEYHETLESRDSKSRRGGGGGESSKRFRSNWTTKTEDEGGDDEDMDDDKFRDLNAEDSDSGLKEDSNNDNDNNNTAIEGGNWNQDVERNGVKVWLNQLSLGRYAPAFAIHEVDDEVLPLLTLEDLKDMGINAVGSRRKMFSAIQKLNRGFS